MIINTEDKENFNLIKPDEQKIVDILKKDIIYLFNLRKLM